MKELYTLKERLVDELKDYGKMEMTAANLDKIDTLAHAAKNVCKIIESEDEGNSGNYPYSYNRGSYRRDSMGRYSRDGMGRYSRDGLADKLRELMADAPDEKTRQDIQRLVDRM